MVKKNVTCLKFICIKKTLYCLGILYGCHFEFVQTPIEFPNNSPNVYTTSTEDIIHIITFGPIVTATTSANKSTP